MYIYIQGYLLDVMNALLPNFIEAEYAQANQPDAEKVNNEYASDASKSNFLDLVFINPVVP